MAIHPGKAIRELIIDSSTSTGAASLVGSRVYPQAAPQNRAIEKKDRIVYHTITTDHEHNFCGAAGLAHARIQLDIYSGSTSGQYGGLKDLAEKCRTALDGFTGTVSITGTTPAESLVVEYIHLDNELDDFEPPSDDSDTYKRRTIQDYRIGYLLSVPTFS